MAGEPQVALKRVDRAQRRGVSDEALRTAAELAQPWIEARKLADAGEMSAAKAALAQARRLATTLDSHSANRITSGIRDALGLGTMKVATPIDREAAELATRAAAHQAARERLHSASAAEEWGEALSAVEECLSLAPADPVAASLRRRLWKTLGLDLTRSHHGRPCHTPLAMQNNESHGRAQANERSRELGRSLRQSTQASPPRTEDTVAGSTDIHRQMLWIDSVGGFLVCLDNEVMLGQPASSSDSNSGPAIPILADISRRHAILRREAGAYVLEPLGRVLLDGQPITGPTVLTDSHIIELVSASERGASSSEGVVRLRFHRPHALSATARLEIESGQRTTPSADAVLLMAESCVLGPSSHSHVCCRKWKDDVILFRKGDQLHCRSAKPLEIDGESITGPALISPGSRVEGEDFALSVEEA